MDFFKPSIIDNENVRLSNFGVQFVDIVGRDGVESKSPKLANNAMTNIETDRGPFKSVQVPDTWKTSEQPLSGAGWMVKMSANGDDKSGFLGIMDPGRSLPPESIKPLSDLLSNNPDIASPRILLPSQIASLKYAMGFTSVGDNQYTNANQYPSQRAPVFSVTSAQLINLNHRTVLEVQGQFVDSDKHPLNYFRGVFVQSPNDPNRVQEFFAQAPTISDLAKVEPTYRDALKTITW